MTMGSFDDSCADSVARIGEILTQVGALSLHLQTRARLHDHLAGPSRAAAAGEIARAASETERSLAAMSRYCLQTLAPKTQNLAALLQSVAAAVVALAAQRGADLRGGLMLVGAKLDRCCAGLRSRTGVWPQGAGVIRLGEQRLWGAITAELHRTEGPDGPVMRGCGEVERLYHDIVQAVGAILERPGPPSLDRRCDLAMQVMAAAVGPGEGPASLPGHSPAALVELLQALHREWRRLADAPADPGQALALALQAGAQAGLAERLRDRLGALQQAMAALAADYGARSKVIDRPAERAAIRARLEADAASWQAILPGLAGPVALIAEIAGEPAVVARHRRGFRVGVGG